MENSIESIIYNAVYSAVKDAFKEAPELKGQQNTNGPLTMTVKETANLVGVSLPKMYELIRKPDFDAVIKVGNKYIILRHKLIDWLERQAN